MKEMNLEAANRGVVLPDRELAYAPIKSLLGQHYLGAMRAGINCALANRQILMHLARRTLGHFFPGRDFPLLYDVSHNTCKVERHKVDGRDRQLHVHRKGATRAFGPGELDLPVAFRAVGQPVLIGGSMGTCSYILAGTTSSEDRAFSSAVHGAGRAMSRHQAMRHWMGRQVVDQLASQGITVRCPSSRGVAEEAPGAYKDAETVVEAAEHAQLARRVARLVPVICVKG
jgi:tRNA-splicing ligase RtcB